MRRSPFDELDSRLNADLAASVERASATGHALVSLLHVLAVALCGFALWLVMPSPVCAGDLGAVGPLHPIAEPDMLNEIEATLRAKQASGELARLQAAGIARAERSIAMPPPVPGLQRTRQAREFRFDPSVRFDEAVLDNRGRVVVPAGTLANPLSVVTLKAGWLFFDARDPAQVSLARREIDAAGSRGQPLKPVLVGGSPLQLSQQWKQPVFFDQFGVMVQRFGLKAVPARVTQQGLHLLVQELVP